MRLPASKFSLPATLTAELTVMLWVACSVTVVPAPATLASKAWLTLAVPLLALTIAAALAGSATNQTAPRRPSKFGLRTT